MNNRLITIVLPLTLGVVAAIFLGAAIKQRMDLNDKQVELNMRGQEIGALEVAVDNLEEQKLDLQKIVDAQPEPAFAFQSYQEMFDALRVCGSGEHKINDIEINNAAFELLLLNDTGVKDSGYEMQDVCKDGNNIAFVIARFDLAQLPDNDGKLFCNGRCDQDIFGMVPAENWGGLSYEGAKLYTSKHKLGFHAEAYDTGCEIDKIITTSPERILLACGNGEAGGFTDWYQYTFSTDELITARGGGGGEIKRQDIYDLFSTYSKQQSAYGGS